MFSIFAVRLRRLLPIALLLGGAACRPGGATPLPPDHWFDLRVNTTAIRAQLAITPEETRRGLMHRTELGKDEGMLFIYSQPSRLSFWMLNTPIPLDIGFFDENGVLLEVRQMFPFDETSTRSHSDRVQFALEMNQGWFRANGKRPGATLDLDHVREAIRARGFDPAAFGMESPAR